MTGTSTKNTARRSGELNNQFRERRTDSAQQGYIAQDGAPNALRGDVEAPWIKVPPFTTEPVLWWNDLLSSTEYLPLPGIQVDQYRTFRVYFEYAIAGATGILSIIPQHRVQVQAQEDDESDDGQWYCTSLVNPTATPLTPSGSRFLEGGFASRIFNPVELRTNDAMGQAMVTGVSRFLLDFDVSSAKAFRLNVFEATEGEDTNRLRLYYSLGL